MEKQPTNLTSLEPLNWRLNTLEVVNPRSVLSANVPTVYTSSFLHHKESKQDRVSRFGHTGVTISLGFPNFYLQSDTLLFAVVLVPMDLHTLLFFMYL